MRVTSILILIALCVALMATQTGCRVAAGAVGAGTGVAYVRGDTEAVLEGKASDVTAASEAAARQMQLTVISKNASGLDGKVVARTAADTPVVVVVKAEGPSASRVSIRVGRFGDDVMQATLLQRIRENLHADAHAHAHAE